jgi:hypothetical protein
MAISAPEKTPLATMRARMMISSERMVCLLYETTEPTSCLTGGAWALAGGGARTST